MYDYLVNHAIKNVWCAPGQDYQSIIQPAKISAFGGTLNRINFQGRITTLPVQGVRMYVFAIGQIFSSRLGIQDNYWGWQSFDTICGDENLIVDLYTDSGVQLPRFQSWYYVTRDKTTILAIQVPSTINVDLDTDTLFVRFYRNAWYASPEAAALPTKPYIQVVGQIPTSTTAIAALMTQYNTFATQQGSVYSFVNGMRTQGIDLFTVNVGDCVEMVYDASIYKVVDFPVENLQFFTSTLDTKAKYLLHYAGLGDEMIDYQDDIDMFLITNPNSNGQFSGVYMHKNAGDTLRNITHKDYSVPTTYVQAFANESNLGNTEGLTVRLQIRHSGMNRPLVYDNNRIQELYKMEDADVLAAMMGLNATVTNWQAAMLENSAYTEIMGSAVSAITNAMVYSAYGYDAISQIIADSPLFTVANSSVMLVDLPYVLQNNSTVYEFDQNGLLLGWYNHTLGSMYSCANSNCALVEVIAGQATQALDETYGITTQTMDAVADYRMYTCPYVNGEPATTQWQDVTGSSQYSIQNGILTWLVDPTVTYTLVKSNDKFLAYNLNLMIADGLLQFTLQSIMTIDYLTNLYNMQIPMGELDIWLNGHALVNEVDYIINFPTVYIINKAYLNNPTAQAQQISIRWTGFCQSNMQSQTVRDYGFVMYDRLSNNDVFNLRDDRVLQIIVGGAVMDRSQVLFAESASGTTVPNPLNGLPYEVRQMIQPLRGMVTGVDTYDALAASQAIDTVVSAYLTEKIPEVDPSSTGSIEAMWHVYSPFVCKILYDMINGVLSPPTGAYSDTTVVAVCTPYQYLLAFDPTQTATLANTDFVAIDPHNLEVVVNVTAAQYAFLSRVVNYYCNNLVNLSPFLNITS
jgi:hypothetical protein